MAIPVIENFTVEDSGGAVVDSLALTKPSGVVSGNLLLLFGLSDDTGGLPVWEDISGWTKIIDVGTTVSDCHIGVWWRIADETEGATETIAHSPGNNDEMIGWYLRISGAHATAPIDVQGSHVAILSDVIVITEVTTTVDDCLAFYIQGFDGADSTSFTVSGAGWTETDEHKSGATGTDVSGSWGTKDMAAAGLTGTATVTASLEDGQIGIQFAIAPAGAGPAFPQSTLAQLGAGI